ncbi:FAD-binding protein [bacterium]|nr:FAD-binding protein [bacterium]
MTLRLREVVIPAGVETPSDSLQTAVAMSLGIPRENLKAMTILKKSLDARRKSAIVYKYQVDVDIEDEDQVLARNQSVAEKSPGINVANPLDGLNPDAVRMRHKPVIIGSGPAGIFAALTLALAGQPCVVVERGEPVEGRMRTVNRLRRRGSFEAESNYCFGEGGAGTFSDGKLTCGKNHPLIRHVFEQFVQHGAPADILYDAKPHIGTDFLMRVAYNMRQHLKSLGTEFVFGRRFLDFASGGDSARWIVRLDDGREIPTDQFVIAIGHSARDTYQMLFDKGLAMVPKPFAMGARIEHPQQQINRIQYGTCFLPQAAEYKLAAQAESRGIWTFCMCPGGHLMPTGAQPGHLAINGMSYHGRKSGFANAAVVVNVLREDFFRGHPLDGMHFQAQLERSAFAAGGGNYNAPAQRLVDFMKGRDSKGVLASTYRPGVSNYRMDKLLPGFIVDALRGAMHDYNKTMRGYLSPEAIVVGLESKTSAPVSMVRDRNLQSVSHPGIFPAGEGAGFAGGIVSAALDGVRIGRAVLEDSARESVALPVWVN